MNLPLVPYSGQNVALVVVQAALVALPAAGLPAWLGRLTGRWWTLVIPGSIVVVIGGLALAPGAADGLTWLALLCLPLLCAAALAWAMHGSRPVFAVGAGALLIVALTGVDRDSGQVAALTLSALSCVTLGRLIAGAAPVAWLRAGLVAMAAIDAVLVFSGGIDEPNAALVSAAPGPGLPRLQVLELSGASMGYGDVFVAGVLGAILAVQGVNRARQLLAAGLLLLASLVFDLLFAVTDTLPATVPVALVTLLVTVPASDRKRWWGLGAAGALVATCAILITGTGDDSPPAPARPAADPMAFLPGNADAIFDLDARVPLASVLASQLVERASRGRVSDAALPPLRGRVSGAILAGRVWIAVQVPDAQSVAAAARPGSTGVLASDGVLVITPNRTTARLALDDAHTPGHRARRGFERRLARMPRTAAARVAFTPAALLSRLHLSNALRTRWGGSLRDGAAAISVRGVSALLSFRMTGAPVALTDLPFAPGTTPPAPRGSGGLVAGLRDPGRTIRFLRDAEVFSGLRLVGRLPGFLRPDLGDLGREATIVTDDLHHVLIRGEPKDPGDWAKKLNRLDALSGLFRRFKLADVRIDRARDGAYTLQEGGTLALRVGVDSGVLVLTDSPTADLHAAVSAGPGVVDPEARGGLALTLKPALLRTLLDNDLELPDELFDRLGDITGWARAEPAVLAGEVRLGLG